MVRLADVEVSDDFVPIGEKTPGLLCRRKYERVQHFPVGETRTKQAEGADTDVNAIMRKYLSQGIIPRMRDDGEGRFGDFSSGMDYHEAMNAVRAADSMFADLPIEVRIACEHDPAKLLDMVYSEDPAKREQAMAFGLIERPKEAAPPVPVVVTNPTPPVDPGA